MAAEASVNVVILGDYEGCLRKYSDWSNVDNKASITIHNNALQGQQLSEVIQDADVIVIVRDRVPINAEIISTLTKLKLVVFTGAKNDTLDVSALAARNIPIAHTAGGPSKDTATELTWTLILASSRRLIEEAALVKQGIWRHDHSVLPMVHGARLGLIGLGEIGSRVARIAKAFNMDIVVWSPNMTAERAAAHDVKFVSLEELLSTSNIVSLHLAVGKTNGGLIDAEKLALMRSDSIFVNTSRSALVKTDDLLEALSNGRPGYAAVDVFDVEPLPADDRLRSTPNLLITPHLGFTYDRVFSAFSEGITSTLEAWLAGEPLPKPYIP